MADDYPLTSTHWGVYRAEVANGKLIKLHNFEEDVDPSPIGNGIVGTLDAPSRVTAPMVRCSWLEKAPDQRQICVVRIPLWRSLGMRLTD